ncbi:MAG: hypothetical protein NWQ54_17665 [Paraglaciecola sp.]|uniref:hypothetical protein n=1 Tax=Paraglaciecola sp. TaxID=1920173 RepID=UPI00273D16C3|nr:hypothetical protein [Paraglaciecola sp.]MDP5030955.1 hypothetical protein [Paraglaciecola sp.]MDP5132705.1 hypothetical protein [Paraglaciecola sp.]
MQKLLDMEILGPFDFLPFQQGGLSLYNDQNAWKPGIYFWVYNLNDSLLINYIGITSTSIAQRQSAHLSSFFSGFYDIYDVDSLLIGHLDKAYTPGDGHEKLCKSQEHLEKQLKLLKFFFAPVSVELSVLKRVETAFIKHVRSSNEFSRILDNGSVSRYRRDDEAAIHVSIHTKTEIRGMPSELFV